MTLLILGLIVFLGVHSVRIFADGWRTRMREKLGENAWKGLYSRAVDRRLRGHRLRLRAGTAGRDDAVAATDLDAAPGGAAHDSRPSFC